MLDNLEDAMLKFIKFTLTGILLLIILSSCVSGIPYEVQTQQESYAIDEIDIEEERHMQDEPGGEEENRTMHPNLVRATVTRVTDGDTVTVIIGTATSENVRLIGVDTPESTREIEHYGKEAAEFTRMNLDGQTVYLEFDVNERDRFGRLLAYVWLQMPLLDGTDDPRHFMFNAQLLLEGYAQVMTISPNVKYADSFLEFEREGRNANRGLWAYIPKAGSDATGVFISQVDLANEIVAIENQTSEKVDISGWILKSVRGNQTFEFPPNTILPSSGILTISSGPRARVSSGVLLWTDKNIWNNDGDAAVLLNRVGAEVSRFE